MFTKVLNSLMYVNISSNIKASQSKTQKETETIQILLTVGTSRNSITTCSYSHVYIS